MRVSAYIPCFNNARTLPETLKSIRDQTVPVDELFVVDDGSSDGSDRLAQELGCRVIRNEENLGRGATRARAISEAACELVLGCDATNAIPNDFVEQALPWFESDKVSAVFGRMWQEDDSTVAQRWRKRHLFKMDADLSVDNYASLSTYAVLMRRSHVLSVGNFRSDLRHSEDAELGVRLLSAGYEVVFDPSLRALSLTSNTIGEVLERYWRWNGGEGGRIALRNHLKQISYSIKVMAIQDLKARDLAAALISLVAPHYQFWASRKDV